MSRLFDKYTGVVSNTGATVTPELSETPDVTVTPEVSETPDVTETPDVSETPEIDEVEENGSDIIENSNEGDVLQPSETVPENQMEVEEKTSEMVVPTTHDGFVPVVLSEEVTAAILGENAASGTLAASTLDYFDRIVSGLSQDYMYIAYRNNSDDANDGVLYFSRFYEVEGNSIIFGKDTKEIIVDRVSTGNYGNYVTNYYSADASHVSVNFSQNGAVIYYTNAAAGFPVLGGYSSNFSYTPFILSALLCALVTVIFNKLMKGR